MNKCLWEMLSRQNNCKRFNKNIRQVKAWKVFELNIFQNLKKSIKLALWKRTCSLIVDWRSTLAQNVVIHLVNQDTWGAVWSLTLGRKYTNFQNDSFGLAEHLKNAKGATSLQSQNQAFPNICSPTVERGIITVKSVGVHSAEQGIWKGTCYLTVVRRHTSAHNVIMHVPTLYVREGVQKKSIFF